MNIFYSDNIDSNTIQLSKTESHHCMHVMRMKLNDIVQVLDGNGNRYTCKIINNKKVTTLDIIKKDYFSKKNFSAGAVFFFYLHLFLFILFFFTGRKKMVSFKIIL